MVSASIWSQLKQFKSILIASANIYLKLEQDSSIFQLARDLPRANLIKANLYQICMHFDLF